MAAAKPVCSSTSSARLVVLCQAQRANVGATWEKLNANWPSTRRQRASIYGLNDTSIGRPSLPAMVAHAFGNPMFLIQVRATVTTAGLDSWTVQ